MCDCNICARSKMLDEILSRTTFHCESDEKYIKDIINDYMPNIEFELDCAEKKILELRSVLKYICTQDWFQNEATFHFNLPDTITEDQFYVALNQYVMKKVGSK